MVEPCCYFDEIIAVDNLSFRFPLWKEGSHKSISLDKNTTLSVFPI